MGLETTAITVATPLVMDGVKVVGVPVLLEKLPFGDVQTTIGKRPPRVAVKSIEPPVQTIPPPEIETDGAGSTCTNIVVVLAHCPGNGINVYVAEASLFGVGDQTPEIPSKLVVGIFIGSPSQIEPIGSKVGVTRTGLLTDTLFVEVQLEKSEITTV